MHPFADRGYTLCIFDLTILAMKKLTFKTKIHASAAKVWEVLWQDTTYRVWTAVFAQGSYAESDWKEGGSVKFLSPTGDGMYSEIARLIPHRLMSFRHIGMIKGGKQVFDDPSIEEWKGAMENYHLSQKDGDTELSVEMDVSEAEVEYFNRTFPRALEKVKEIAEKG